MFATFNGFTFSLEYTSEKNYGIPIYRYQVITPDPMTIFEGEHYKPSISAVRNSLLLPIELMQWICLSYENNDHSLFDHYNLHQLDFARCERIEEFEYVADAAWLEIDNKNYMFVLNDRNIQVIDIDHLHSPLIIIKDIRND